MFHHYNKQDHVTPAVIIYLCLDTCIIVGLQIDCSANNMQIQNYCPVPSVLHDADPPPVVLPFCSTHLHCQWAWACHNGTTVSPVIGLHHPHSSGLVDCIFMSHRQRGHLKMAPHLLSLAKDVKPGKYTVPTGNQTPGCRVVAHNITAALLKLSTIPLGMEFMELIYNFWMLFDGRP